MVIEMSRNQRNVDVAALANGLTVIESLKNRKTPRMLLHLPGEGVKISCASVGSE